MYNSVDKLWITPGLCRAVYNLWITI